MLNTLGRNLNFCFTKTKPTSENDPIPLDHSRPFIKTFNSLFDQTSSSHQCQPKGHGATPDFATAIASRRFFFSSPGRSNSIIDSLSSSSSDSSVAGAPPENDDVAVGVAVPTYSPDPYGDFRKSMEEMVEARGMRDVRESWEQLHELLTCYLSLNPKSTHTYIFAAFADLLVSLISNVI